MSMCVNSIPGVKLKVGQALPVSFSVVSFSRPNHSLWDALQLSFSLRSSPFLVVLGSSGSSWFYNNQRAGAGRSGSLYINTALVCIRVFHKNTFLKEKVVHTLTTPYRSIYKPYPKDFFPRTKSKRSHHLVKNGGLLQCRFSLSLLSAWPDEGLVKIYIVKVLHF